MKYSEFKAEVEKLGFVMEDGTPIYVDKSKDGETLMSIGKHQQFWLDPGWGGFNNLTEDQKLKLYELGYELSKTPLADRDEEKRYRLRKIPIPLLREASDRFYRKPLLSNYGPCTSSDITESFQYQIIFTESEIAEMDITGFEKVEVEE